MDFQSIALPAELRHRARFQSGGKDKTTFCKNERGIRDFLKKTAPQTFQHGCGVIFAVVIVSLLALFIVSCKFVWNGF
jgi:hypothetical protein